jgi:hypothetical protein
MTKKTLTSKMVKNIHAPFFFLFLSASSIVAAPKGIVPPLAIPQAKAAVETVKDIVHRPKTTSPDINPAEARVFATANRSGVEHTLSKATSMPDMASFGARSTSPHTPNSTRLSLASISPATYNQDDYKTFCRAQTYAALITHLARNAIGTQKVQATYLECRPIALFLRNKKNILLLVTENTHERFFLATPWGGWRVCTCTNSSEKATQKIVEGLQAIKIIECGTQELRESHTTTTLDSEKDLCRSLYTIAAEKPFYQGKVNIYDFMSPREEYVDHLHLVQTWQHMQLAYKKEKTPTLAPITEDHEPNEKDM